MLDYADLKLPCIRGTEFKAKILAQETPEGQATSPTDLTDRTLTLYAKKNATDLPADALHTWTVGTGELALLDQVTATGHFTLTLNPEATLALRNNVFVRCDVEGDDGEPETFLRFTLDVTN